MTFTYAKCFTPGLMAFGVDGSTDHFASRAEIQAAFQRAEFGSGWALCGGMTLNRDELKALLTTLGAVVA